MRAVLSAIPAPSPKAEPTFRAGRNSGFPALASDPDILIFDDSFSALDYRTDAALRRAIKENTDNKTVIIVAQRISTIANAEQIIVLDDGRIAGMGTHQQLLESCDVYRQIALSQLSEEELQK